MAHGTEKPIESRAIGIMAEQLGLGTRKVLLEDQISEDLGADSLDILEMAIQFEDEFDVNLDGLEVPERTTVGQIVEKIRQKGGK